MRIWLGMPPLCTQVLSSPDSLMEYAIVGGIGAFGLGWLARVSPVPPPSIPCACTCNCLSAEVPPAANLGWWAVVGLSLIVGGLGLVWLVTKQQVVISTPDKGSRKGSKGVFGSTGKALPLTF